MNEHLIMNLAKEKQERYLAEAQAAGTLRDIKRQRRSRQEAITLPWSASLYHSIKALFALKIQQRRKRNVNHNHSKSPG